MMVEEKVTSTDRVHTALGEGESTEYTTASDSLEARMGKQGWGPSPRYCDTRGMGLDVFDNLSISLPERGY